MQGAAATLTAERAAAAVGDCTGVFVDVNGERAELGTYEDWFCQAELMRDYLGRLNEAWPPDADTILNIGRAYDLLFNTLALQRRAMRLAERWCKQRKTNKSLGLEPLIDGLHGLDFNVPRAFKVPASAAKKILGARRRPVSPATVLAVVASAAGAFGVTQKSDVKTVTRKLQRAFEATRTDTNEKASLRKKGIESPRKPVSTEKSRRPNTIAAFLFRLRSCVELGCGEASWFSVARPRLITMSSKRHGLSWTG